MRRPPPSEKGYFSSEQRDGAAEKMGCLPCAHARTFQLRNRDFLGRRNKKLILFQTMVRSREGEGGEGASLRNAMEQAQGLRQGQPPSSLLREVDGGFRKASPGATRPGPHSTAPHWLCGPFPL